MGKTIYYRTTIYITAMLFCLLNSLPLSAQTTDNQKDVSFDSSDYNFGVFKQSDGPKSHTFEIKNNGSRPLIIHSVLSSCGCTSTTWTKAPIPPGKTGNITATYQNNQGPNIFDKKLTVYTNFSPDAPYVLRIRGEVKAKKLNAAETHPVLIGNGLRLRKSTLEIGQVSQSTIKKDSVEVINNGKSTMELSYRSSDRHSSAYFSPKTLAPNEKGWLVFSVDATDGSRWGNVESAGEILINGQSVTNNKVTITGSIKFNSNNLTKEEKNKAPIPVLSASSYNFYEMPSGNTINTVFTIRNSGLTPLKLYKTDYSHSGIKAETITEIAPGSSIPVKVTIQRKDKGEVSYYISIYTNAPLRPVISFMVYGEYK